VESKIDNMQSEIVKLRRELIVDSFCVLEEKLDAKFNQLVDGRLRKFESRLDQLSGKAAAVYGTYCQPSVGNELNRVYYKNESHTRFTPTSVSSAMSQSQSKCKCDNNNDINKHCVNGSARAETTLGASEITCKNDVVVGDEHFRSSVMRKMTLPKYNDCKRQHIVNFLEEFVIFN
jgi:hypothetical protein